VDTYPSFTITVAEAAEAPAPAPRATPPTAEAPPVTVPETSSPAPTTPVAPAEGCTDCTTIEGGGTLQPGQQLTLTYTGFQPGEEVTVVLHSTPVTLGVFTADETGSVTADVTIPGDAEAGRHTLTLSGPVTGDHDIGFQLTAAEEQPVAAAPAADRTDLTLPLVAGAVILVLLCGAGYLVVRRRHHPKPATQETATPIAEPIAKVTPAATAPKRS
jgi:hypothetical protein